MKTQTETKQGIVSPKIEWVVRAKLTQEIVARCASHDDAILWSKSPLTKGAYPEGVYVDWSQSPPARTTQINYKAEAAACDRIRQASKDFAQRWNIPEMVAYNAMLEAAGIERDHYKAHADKLAEALRAWEYAGNEGGISMVDWFEVARKKTREALAAYEKAKGAQQ